MPRKSKIEPFRVGERYRVIIPKDITGTDKRQTRWFASKTKALTFCDELENTRGELGSRLLRLGKVEQGRLVEALNAAGGAEAVLDAVRFWKQQKPKEQVTLKELAIRTVAAKETSGKSGHYANCLRRSLQLFTRGREAELAHSVNPSHVEAWINSNPNWSQFTKRTYLRDVTTMFSFGVKNGFVVENPAVKVERPSMVDSAPQILTVEDAERLMRSAERIDSRLVQYLALCLFGGLRPSEAFRIQPENMRDGHVEVYGKKVRARNRRLVTIGETLKAWLDKYPGDFSPVNLQRRIIAVRKGTAVTDFGPVEPIRWTQDCMRHSFVSYHYAIHGAKATATEAGHSEAVLFQHYRELVRRADADMFWGILPK